MVKSILLMATVASAQRAGQLVGDQQMNTASAYAWSQYLGQNLQKPVETTEKPQTTRRWQPSGRHYKNASKKVQAQGSAGGLLAKWLPWGAWNACTGLCGNGVQTRVRR